jgi:hypothetical protein
MAVYYGIELKLDVVNDKIFLRFPDPITDNDINTEVRDGKLYYEGKEISLQEFIEKIIKIVKTY